MCKYCTVLTSFLSKTEMFTCNRQKLSDKDLCELKAEFKV